MRPREVTLSGLLLGALMAIGAASPISAQDGSALGQEVYDLWCAACHGYEGQGDGYAATYMLPRPRDFTQALYQIRTTASGQLPTDDDIMRVINEGMPGTTMPGWEDELNEDERLALVDYLKSFSRFFAGDQPEVLSFTSPGRVTEEGMADGRAVYELIECNRCHGAEGRGDGTSSPTLADDNGMPIYAADLTENWKNNGGGTVEDVYRRLRTGLDGTPMPGFSDLIEAGVITDDQLWNLSHFVRSLAPEDPPAITEVIRAELVDETPLPSSLADPLWDSTERFYIPMGGQIITSPRWFAPNVDGLWVQALHDGTELALKVSWSDPSQSPDPEWADFQALILDAIGPKEGDDLAPGPRPDRLALQFPMEIPEGADKPYFLMGDARNPVYVWSWESTGSGAVEGDARGIGTVAPQGADGQSLTTDVAFAAGQWSVVFRRALQTDDPGDLQFRTAEAVPIGFAAWDGDNGESGNRASISSWYYVFLQESTPATVVVAPLIATLLTAGLGVFVVAQAQKRENAAADDADEGISAD